MSKLVRALPPASSASVTLYASGFIRSLPAYFSAGVFLRLPGAIITPDQSRFRRSFETGSRYHRLRDCHPLFHLGAILCFDISMFFMCPNKLKSAIFPYGNIRRLPPTHMTFGSSQRFLGIPLIPEVFMWLFCAQGHAIKQIYHLLHPATHYWLNHFQLWKKSTFWAHKKNMLIWLDGIFRDFNCTGISAVQFLRETRMIPVVPRTTTEH